MALGAWVFFPMIPALAMMTDGARLAIAGWMLLFAALGAALMLNPSPSSGHSEGRPDPPAEELIDPRSSR